MQFWIFQMLSVLLYSNSCIRRVLNVSLKVSFTDTNTIFDFNLKKLTSNKIDLGIIFIMWKPKRIMITKLVFVYYHYTQKFFIYNCNLRISVYYLTTTNDVMLCCVLIIMKSGLRLHNYFWLTLILSYRMFSNIVELKFEHIKIVLKTIRRY